MTVFSVIIVAAGTGSRAGPGLPKQYRALGGKTVLRRSLESFLFLDGLKSLKVVIHPDHRDLYEKSVAGLGLGPPVIGGSTRRESVSAGLAALDEAEDSALPVLIHDAARPFVDDRIIRDCLSALETSPAVVPVLPVADTLRKVTDGRLDTLVDRSGLFAVQTPQGFHYNAIRRAHETLAGDFTDDSAMVSDMGIPVETVQGSRENIKLTSEDDFQKSVRMTTRTGLGYDVHAFGEHSGVIRIGGIDIPHTHRLLGHSDADVVLHAVTDAIYGTIASGDIGSHFPPSKPEYKNMDSAVFLQAAVEELTGSGGRLVHIDATVICEAPKIGPHRDAMRARIAEICGIDIRGVSVKATTTEGLGFAGRREGIAAQALITVELPS